MSADARRPADAAQISTICLKLISLILLPISDASLSPTHAPYYEDAGYCFPRQTVDMLIAMLSRDASITSRRCQIADMAKLMLARARPSGYHERA